MGPWEPIGDATVRAAGIRPGQSVADLCCGAGASAIPAAVTYLSRQQPIPACPIEGPAARPGADHDRRRTSSRAKETRARLHPGVLRPGK
jgi:hypothetical protein